MATIRRLTGWRSYRKEQTNKETDSYDLKRLKNLPSEPVASPTGVLALYGLRTARQSMYGCNSFETVCLGVVCLTHGRCTRFSTQWRDEKPPIGIARPNPQSFAKTWRRRLDRPHDRRSSGSSRSARAARFRRLAVRSDGGARRLRAAPRSVRSRPDRWRVPRGCPCRARGAFESAGIRDVRSKHPEMSLIEDDDVVQTLATDGPDDAFDAGILPGRTWGGADGCQAQGFEIIRSVRRDASGMTRAQASDQAAPMSTSGNVSTPVGLRPRIDGASITANCDNSGLPHHVATLSAFM